MISHGRNVKSKKFFSQITLKLKLITMNELKAYNTAPVEKAYNKAHVHLNWKSLQGARSQIERGE